jgi:tetratricopeptide (TPR) repeat protein
MNHNWLCETAAWLLTVIAAASLASPPRVTAQAAQHAKPDAAALHDRLNRVGTQLFSGGSAGVDDVIRELKSILAIDPGSAQAHLFLGIAYRLQGAPELVGEAKAELVQALALNPDFVPARYYLAQLYLDLGRARRAREEMEAALLRFPKHPQFLALLGEAERQLGNPRRAVEITREAVKTDESFAEARYYLALALFDLGERGEAIEEMERVVQSGPPVVDPYLNLGLAYLEASRYDDALKALSQGLQINPTRPELRIQRARAYRSKGLLDKAEEELNLATSAGTAPLSAPFSEQVRFNFRLEQGLLKLQQGELETAAGIFRKLLDIDPNHGPTNRHLAEVYLRQGDYQRSSASAARAEKLGFPLSEDQRKLLDEGLRHKQSDKRQ